MNGCSQMSTPALSLEGVTVIECAGIFAGPWTGTLVGDFETEVVKVEHPESAIPSATSSWFETLGRNEKSVGIDLRRDGLLTNLAVLVQTPRSDLPSGSGLAEGTDPGEPVEGTTRIGSRDSRGGPRRRSPPRRTARP